MAGRQASKQDGRMAGCKDGRKDGWMDGGTEAWLAGWPGCHALQRGTTARMIMPAASRGF